MPELSPSDRKVYNIEKIKGHQPRIPQHVDELKFMIEWKKKIGEEEGDSIEGWKTNDISYYYFIVRLVI